MTQKLLTLRRGSCGKSKEGCIVAIVTQLSLDRLGRLHYLCNSWGNGYDNCSGHVVAAILDEDRTIECLSNNDNTSGKKQIEALEEMVALIPNCSLETILVGKSLQYSSSYPINALRNIALQACTTEFVFLLDVDCIPSNDALYNMIGTAERLSSLRKMCTEEAAAIVVPCFEPSSSYIEAPISPTFSCSDALKKVCFSCAGSPNSGLQPFMGDRFNRGHRATDFTRLANIWNERLSSTDNAAHTPRFYPITFEEGFEPYVIVNRLYAPLYDEALTGYGRNKALHLYHLHRMGFSFLVCADACLVHLPHPATVDRGRLLGAPVTADSLVDSGVQYGLLQQIKDIYSCSRSSITTHCSSWAIESRVKNYEVEEAISRKEIVNEFSMEDEHLHPDSWCIRWGLSSSSKKVSKVRVAQRIYPVGSACCWWDSPAVQGYASSLLSKHYESVLESSEETSTNDSGAALQATLTNLCSMHMRYEAPVLHIHRYVLVIPVSFLFYIIKIFLSTWNIYFRSEFEKWFCCIASDYTVFAILKTYLCVFLLLFADSILSLRMLPMRPFLCPAAPPQLLPRLPPLCGSLRTSQWTASTNCGPCAGAGEVRSLLSCGSSPPCPRQSAHKVSEQLTRWCWKFSNKVLKVDCISAI